MNTETEYTTAMQIVKDFFSDEITPEYVKEMLWEMFFAVLGNKKLNDSSCSARLNLAYNYKSLDELTQNLYLLRNSEPDLMNYLEEFFSDRGGERWKIFIERMFFDFISDEDGTYSACYVQEQREKFNSFYKKLQELMISLAGITKAVPA